MSSMSVPRWSVYLVLAALIASLSFSVGAIYTASGESHDTTYFACLYGGSLSQVGTTPPANCGRGTQISWSSESSSESDGQAGIAGYEVVTFATSIPAATSAVSSVACPAGKAVLGGGPYLDIDVGSGVIANFYIRASYAAYDELEDIWSWHVLITNFSGGSVDFDVVATCATIAQNPD